jgi:hypothetical protein
VEPTFTLSPEQRGTFDHEGVLRIPGWFPKHQIAAMADRLWADLDKRFGIDRNRPETWTNKRPAQFQALIRTGVFDPLGPRIGTLADAFLGAGNWEVPKHFGQPLVTFPTGRWDVPHTMWHLDVPPTDCLNGLPVVRVFTFLEPVLPHGGGTCYVAGSHRVMIDRARDAAPGDRLRSADIKTVMRSEESWFAALFSRDGGERERRFVCEGGIVRGIEVRVREMTGEPGDAIVMHPATLHAIAPNGLDRPRLMLVQALPRRPPPCDEAPCPGREAHQEQ